ncbi:hypothetical protein [Alsobacter sp. R-9]
MSLRDAGRRVLLCSTLFNVGGAGWVRPVVSGDPPRRHVIFVAELQPDGAFAGEQHVTCDLGAACEISLTFGLKDLDRLDLRIFAEDSGGFSIAPIGGDGSGHYGVGRRKDVAWGRARTTMATIDVRPLRPAREDDDAWPLGVVMREDLPAVGHVVIAVASEPIGR